MLELNWFTQMTMIRVSSATDDTNSHLFQNIFSSFTQHTVYLLQPQTLNKIKLVNIHMC